jgi:membrane fusion protein (multidrug efflux system)
LRSQQGLYAQADAAAHDDEAKAKRMRELATRGVIARQDLDDAVAAAESARAAATAAQANVENARINLGYATITAPIAGRAGMANVTEGALVSPTDANPLTTVQQIDPVYVEFSQPLAEVETLRGAQKSGDLQLASPGRARVEVVLPDGSVYPHAGTLNFADLAVDPQTGAVSLRAIVPNPERTLLPGMFVKLRLTLGMRHHAMEVPQAAVQRDAQGAYLYVVGANDVVSSRRVVLDGQRGSQWVVESGLDDGDRVIVSGVQKTQPGGKVQPVVDTPDANAPAEASTTENE